MRAIYATVRDPDAIYLRLQCLVAYRTSWQATLVPLAFLPCLIPRWSDLKWGGEASDPYVYAVTIHENTHIIASHWTPYFLFGSGCPDELHLYELGGSQCVTAHTRLKKSSLCRKP